MDKLQASISDRLETGRSNALRGAVRRALALGTGLLAAGVALAFARQMPPIFPLRYLLQANRGDGSVGFVLSSVASLDRAGNSLSRTGDINGDGIDDFIIGAYLAKPGGRDTPAKATSCSAA